MSEHTIEPWRVAEESFDNDGIHESVIRGLDGRAAIAVTLEFGPNNPGMREANARRIVACVNACAGITTEVLEQMPNGPASLLPMYARLEQQRDKLRAAVVVFIGCIVQLSEACLILFRAMRYFTLKKYLDTVRKCEHNTVMDSRLARIELEEQIMSVFAKLSKNDRATVFSGNEIPGTWVPTGDIMPDGSRRTLTREGWNTFRMAKTMPKGQSVYGSREVWVCDVSMASNERIAETAL